MTATPEAGLFPLGADETPDRKLTSDHVSTIDFEGQEILKVEPEAIRYRSMPLISIMEALPVRRGGARA